MSFRRRIPTHSTQSPAAQRPASSSAGAASAGLAGAWTRGSEYNELLRSKVRSMAMVDGFLGVTSAEAYAAADSFAAWDVDRDGVLSRDEFAKIVHELEESAIDDAQTDRLFALVDADGSGDIDFNEWLAHFKQLSEIPET